MEPTALVQWLILGGTLASVALPFAYPVLPDRHGGKFISVSLVGPVGWRYRIGAAVFLALILLGLYAAFVIAIVIAFAAPRTTIAERIEELGRYSYGVYLVHTVVLSYAARAVYHLLPSLLAHGLLFMAVLVATGLAVPLMAMALVRRSRVSGAYRYVFG